MTKNSHTEVKPLPSLIRLTQKLRREELKLARLKNRQNEERVRDTRLKYRLGGLIYLLGWEQTDRDWLQEQLKNAGEQLSSAEKTERYRLIGSEEFQRRRVADLKVEALSTTGLTEDQRLSLNHQVIELGDMMVKYGLDQLPRDAVLGFLITLQSDSK